MNWFLIGIIIFVILYFSLNAFAKASSKKIAQNLDWLASRHKGKPLQQTELEKYVW